MNMYQYFYGCLIKYLGNDWIVLWITVNYHCEFQIVERMVLFLGIGHIIYRKIYIRIGYWKLFLHRLAPKI
jgi:hypothetical protein